MESAPHATECEADLAAGPLLALPIATRTDAIVAGHLAVRFALASGAPRSLAASIGIAASELASNIARHARSGRLALHAAPRAITLIALDRGPGDPVVLRAHLSQAPSPRPFSPGASLGCGLGAVARLMHSVDVSARPGGGLRVLARCAW